MSQIMDDKESKDRMDAKESTFISIFFGLIATPLFWYAINHHIASTNVQEEYNLLRNKPENARLVESYRIYDGRIPQLLWEAAEHKKEEWEKQSDISKLITYPQKIYLDLSYPEYGYIGQDGP